MITINTTISTYTNILYTKNAIPYASQDYGNTINYYIRSNVNKILLINITLSSIFLPVLIYTMVLNRIRLLTYYTVSLSSLCTIAHIPWICKMHVRFCWLCVVYSPRNYLYSMRGYMLAADPFFDGETTLIARFVGPTWGPSGADRTQVVPMLAPGTLLYG